MLVSLIAADANVSYLVGQVETLSHGPKPVVNMQQFSQSMHWAVASGIYRCGSHFFLFKSQSLEMGDNWVYCDIRLMEMIQ